MKQDPSSKPKVLVSGCYDLLHAGHVRFFETAAEYGDLHVCVGSDENVRHLKGRVPKFNERERLYMVRAIRHVHHARVSSGSGMLDFEPDMAEISPDFFVVNEDGGSDEKRRHFRGGISGDTIPVMATCVVWKADRLSVV